MSLREAILFACLAALGIVNFRDQSADNQRELAALIRREQALTRDLAALRGRARELRRESDALEHDRYYVARVARADLGWRPSLLRDPGLLPPGLPEPVVPPSALVHNIPSLPVQLPSPIPVSAPRAPPAAGGPQPPPPTPPQLVNAAVARCTLASLGYGSVEHFQTKMMEGRSDGVLDAATAGRAQQLLGLLQRLGYSSVKTFQQRNRLTADGIMGRRTEQRALELLRRRPPRRSGGYLAANGR